MALDPSIILQASNIKPIDYATTLAQVGQLRAQRDASELQQVQLSRLTRQDQVDAANLAARKAAGAQWSAGDTTGAIQTAGSAGDLDLVKTLQTMSDDQRKRVFDISQHAAPILAQIATHPAAERPALIQQAAPTLAQAGWGPQQLAELQQNVGNDGWFSSKIAAAHTIAEFEAQADKDRTYNLDVDKFGHTVKQDAATFGESVREHNLAHSDAAAGRAVTMRGQNMVDHRDQEKIDLQKNAILPQQTAADIAAQYLAGDKSALGNLGRGTQGGINITMVRNEISRQMAASGMKPADVAAKIAEFTGTMAGARTTGTMGAKIDYGVNELKASIPLAIQASSVMPRGNFVPLTRLSQMGSRLDSNPALKDFAVKTQAVINAYNMVAGRAGTSAEERKHNTQLLETADSPEAYRAALKAMDMEGTVAKGASKQTMADVTGHHAGGTLKPGAGNVLVWTPH